MKKLLLAVLCLFTFCLVNGQVAPPVVQAADAGHSVAFYATKIVGTAPFSYQWMKGNGVILGATGAAVPAWVNTGTPIAGSAYVINSVTVADAGVYTLVVTNASGAVTSNTATLTVHDVINAAIDMWVH